MATTLEGRRAAVADASFANGTHTGLWLDKYLARLRLPETKDEAVGAAVRDLLLEAAGSPVPEGYEAAFARRRAALEALDGGVDGGVTRLFTAEARGRLVVGLGTQAVRETNLALLHTWGVPYLPGSALKGLASSAANALIGGDAWKKGREGREQGEDHALLFGDTAREGCVIFHDAWWIPERPRLPLDLDVMTVHHTDYYRDGGRAPADWDEPNPVAFLTARGRYLVALSGPEAWVLRAGELLERGLGDLGIGAKTQAGYGRMALARARSQGEIEEAALREKHKATLEALANLPAQHKGAPTAKQHVQKLLEALRAGAPVADVYAIACSLYRRDPHFWRSWAKDARRTEEERAFVEQSGMLGEAHAGGAAMKKVLIASVGGSPEPIVGAIVRSRPDFVYFLCSTGKGGSDAMVDKTIVPRAQMAEGSYAVERVQSPDDLDDVVAKCARIEADLDARFAGHSIEVTANYTGGTKTMSAGLVALAQRRGWRAEVTERISREWSGPVSKVSLDAVTTFMSFELPCSEGINVIIGENGTGKTHLLKCAYALLRAAEEAERGLPMPTWGGDKLQRVLVGRFRSFFAEEQAPTRVSVECGHRHFERVEAPGLSPAWSPPVEVTVKTLFLPSRETLTMGPKFVSAYLDRAVPFDETYHDLCRELGQFELREPRPEFASVLEDLEQRIGGRVRLTDLNEFVVETKRGMIAAPMVAEGHRKLGSLAYLIRTGALTNQTILFWDEPESNLNPKLVRDVARLIRKLAKAGVQIFVATHDYLVARELSMEAEYKAAEVDTRFFALRRVEGDGPVEVESGAYWGDLQRNPIFDAYAAHYEREQVLFALGPGEKAEGV